MTTKLEKPITAFQIKRIMQNCSYQVEIKDEWVQWVTGDVNCTSLKAITHDQAIKILHAQTGSTDSSRAVSTENWGAFDAQNGQHRTIMALLRTADIVVKNGKWGEVADMAGFFHIFLQSKKSPVNKPLKSMSPMEVSKIIKALEGVSLWKNSI